MSAWESFWRSVRRNVSVDIATGKGQIFAGFNNGGTFTVEPLSTAGKTDGAR